MYDAKRVKWIVNLIPQHHPYFLTFEQQNFEQNGYTLFHLVGVGYNHHTPEVYGGISEDVSAQLLKSFFAARR